MATTRKDGRGHWPRGRRRHQLPAADAERLQAALRRCVIAHVARLTGRDSRTLRRWRDGIDYPDPVEAGRVTGLAERAANA